jgi:DNA polymerase-3 subunit beta
MKFSIARESILAPLQLVTGVVERRQTLPVLSNTLVVVETDSVALTGTDLEVEVVGRASGADVVETGSTTIPARKLLDIVKSLPEGADVNFKLDGEKVTVSSARSRFTLSTLPASEFPNVEGSQEQLSFSLDARLFRQMIEKTAFSMAQQDVRYYLNGMLLELKDGVIRLVATDGHRLAMVMAKFGHEDGETHQAIVPRKGILELSRLLADVDGEVSVAIGANHIQVTAGDVVFTSKLVDGRFPDYERVIPRGSDKQLLANRDTFRTAFSRASILSNEKYRGVRLQLEKDMLRITANNPEQEQAEEEVAIEYEGDSLEIGFNVNYLLDVFSAIKGDDARLSLSDSNSSALLDDPADESAVYVVMPMRL